MPLASGMAAQFGLAEESSYGTITTPNRFYELVSESIKAERERINSSAIRPGRRVLHRWAPGIVKVSGEVELELPNRYMSVLLKHMFGSLNITGSGPYTHTATPGDLAGKSLTVQVGRPDIGGTVRPFTYPGCKVSEWSIKASVNEYAQLSLSLVGRDETTATSLATASYPSDLSPFVFTHASLTVASSSFPVKEIEISGNNGLADDRRYLVGANSGLISEPLEAAVREYTGSFKADFTDLTAYNRFVNGTEAALELTFNAGASSQLVITCNVRFDGETPNVEGHELLELSQPFVCVHSSSDASAITAVLTTSEATS